MIYLLKFVVLLTALVWMAVGAVAGPLEDGEAAYETGDHKRAYELWRPLAEHGHAEAQKNLGIMYH